MISACRCGEFESAEDNKKGCVHVAREWREADPDDRFDRSTVSFGSRFNAYRQHRVNGLREKRKRKRKRKGQERKRKEKT